jgi:hypothetical protein
MTDYHPLPRPANSRPIPSLPVIQHWYPIRVTEPVPRIIGHIAARVGGYEAFRANDYSGERSLGIFESQDLAEDAIFRAEAALAERVTARQLQENELPYEMSAAA